MAGLTLVKEEKDVDKLDGDDATLMSELQRPQVGLFVYIGIDTHLYSQCFRMNISLLNILPLFSAGCRRPGCKSSNCLVL